MKFEDKIKIAEDIVELLDNKFEFLGFKFGFDPLIGLIPIAGDLIPLAISLYLIWVAYTENVPARKIGFMIFIVVIDFLIGIIPVVGDLADFVFRAHIKNLAILKKELQS